MYRDSLDKIVDTYFAAVTAVPFEYKGIRYEPKKLRVSPLIRRGYTCPPMCAGCCPVFSLVYLPEEIHPYPLTQRFVKFDSREVILFEDGQRDNTNWHCRNVDQSNGRCTIHRNRPFHCDFELIRVLKFEDHNRLTQKLFGRGWALKRVDEQRGALCEMLDPTDENIADVARKLERLKRWADHFGLKTVLDEVIDWVKFGCRDAELEILPGGQDVATDQTVQV